jgi:hypothetical protein
MPVLKGQLNFKLSYINNEGEDKILKRRRVTRYKKEYYATKTSWKK